MTSTYTVNGKSYSYSCGYANSLGDELSSFTTPLGTVTYTRDDLKRLKSKRYTCEKVSALQSYTYAPNRADGTYTSQLVKNLNFTVGSNVQRLSYTYDASGNITAIEDNAGAVASYEYDGLGRLTRENISGKKTVVYSYDGAGNLTSKKEYAYTTGALGAIKATHSYQYAGGTWGDRLTFYDGACITYNAAGYPICYRGNALTWSNSNLTKYGNLTFAYNDAGIRTKKGTTEYFVKGNLILAEKRGDTVIHYYYDDSGVAGFEYNGQKYFYRKNLQGDIIGIYDSCWNLLGQYEYDAWGNLLSQIGSEILNINPFRYRGYYYDAETGLYYLNSRYYDPETGRFISPDSIRYLNPMANNGLNLYTYCGDNPSNLLYNCAHHGRFNDQIMSVNYLETNAQMGSKINVVNAISSAFAILDQWYSFLSSVPDAFLNFFGPDGFGLKSLNKYVNGLKYFGTGMLVVGSILSWGESVHSNFSNSNYSIAEAIGSSILDAGYFAIKGMLTYGASNLIGKAAIACGTAVGGAAIAYLGASFGAALAIGSGVAVIVGVVGAVVIYVLSTIVDGLWNDFKEFIFG